MASLVVMPHDAQWPVMVDSAWPMGDPYELSWSDWVWFGGSPFIHHWMARKQWFPGPNMAVFLDNFGGEKSQIRLSK